MSIVEKAISREPKPSRRLGKPVLSRNVVVEQKPASPDTPDSEVVQVSSVSSRGLFSVLEDKDLFRAFRFLKRAVLAKVFGPTLAGAEAGKVIMVTSAMPGAGKSFTAFNLAVSIAQEQLVNVVLIDADTVRHNLSNLLGMSSREGLQDILVTGDVAIGTFDTDVPGLRFIPSGLARENATELLASEYMQDLLKNFSDPNTIVILDATPLLVSSEADALSAHADHIMLVIEAGKTSVDEIENMRQLLEKSTAQVSFILNKLRAMDGKSGQYYYYSSY
jgi:protein-tyrosine kinase